MRHSVAIAITLGCITVTHAQKTAGVFYPSRLVETARENIAKHDWAAQTRDDIVAEAQGWTVYSDDELWAMMFGATIPRSWMVWSNGVCPSCEEPVVMYEWEMDSLAQPWKCSCPHCDEAFPKNDFGAFLRSRTGRCSSIRSTPIQTIPCGRLASTTARAMSMATASGASSAPTSSTVSGSTRSWEASRRFRPPTSSRARSATPTRRA